MSANYRAKTVPKVFDNVFWQREIQELAAAINSQPAFTITSADDGDLLQYSSATAAWVDVARIGYGNLPTGNGTWATSSASITVSCSALIVRGSLVDTLNSTSLQTTFRGSASPDAGQENAVLTDFVGRWTSTSVAAVRLVTGNDTAASSDVGKVQFWTAAQGTTIAKRWEIDSDGHLVPVSSAAYDIGTATLPVKRLYVGTSGTGITKFAVYSVSLTPTTIASQSVQEVSFAVTGITTADKLSVNHPAISNNVTPTSWRASTTDGVVGAFANLDGTSSAAAAAGTYHILAVRS